METTEKKTKEPERVPDESTEPVAPYNLLYITRAYNNREISFDEWLRLTKEWAERMIQQYGKAK
jgi:hypothetical protein